jgi:exodeoxyribonuclease V
MTPTLTDHQWSAVKLAASWYKEADSSRHLFENAWGDTEEVSGKYRPATMLGKGQDFFFGGFAGTGKTTVLPATLEEFGLTPDEVAFVAPTGKAAKVMGSKLRDFGIGAVPTTIHKLIYLPRKERAAVIQGRIDAINERILHAKVEGIAFVTVENRGEIQTLSIKEAEKKLHDLGFDLARAMDNDDGPTFTLRAREDIDPNIKLVIVDEGSMVGADVANDLATFGLPILAFGDPGQLPPVGDAYGFDCEHPDAFLTEIHRQAKDNPIIQLATLAREGRELKLGDYGDGVKVVTRRNDDVTLNMDREAMVLCGTHVKRWNLTREIRGALGFTSTGPCIGEPLLFCKNSKKLATMVNGTIVTCMTEVGDLRKGAADFTLRVKDEEGGGEEYVVTVTQGLFEEHAARKRNAYSATPTAAFKSKVTHEHLDWGHVLTVHKSQGSQWDDVVVHDESGAFREASARWLYTGITRAAKQLTVVR